MQAMLLFYINDIPKGLCALEFMWTTNYNLMICVYYQHLSQMKKFRKLYVMMGTG